MTLTVIFDLGNVLVPVHARQLLEQLGPLLGVSARQAGSLLTPLLPRVELYERGRLNAVEFYREVLACTGIEASRYPFSLYRRHWCSVLGSDPGMEALFRQVCGACPTCVLSNTNDLHWLWTAQHHDLLHHAAFTLTSFQCGLYKPEPAIYRLALARFGVEDPATALFIDDKEENVAVARAEGMGLSFVHVDEHDTRARLAAHGVL